MTGKKHTPLPSVSPAQHSKEWKAGHGKTVQAMGVAWKESFGKSFFEGFKFWNWPKNTYLLFKNYIKEYKKLSQKKAATKSASSKAVAQDVLKTPTEELSKRFSDQLGTELDLKAGEKEAKEDVSTLTTAVVVGLKATENPDVAIDVVDRLLDHSATARKGEEMKLEKAEAQALATVSMHTLVDLKKKYTKEEFKKYLERLAKLSDRSDKLKGLLAYVQKNFKKIFRIDGLTVPDIAIEGLIEKVFPKSVAKLHVGAIKPSFKTLLSTKGAPTITQLADFVYIIEDVELLELPSKMYA